MSAVNELWRHIRQLVKCLDQNGHFLGPDNGVQRIAKTCFDDNRDHRVQVDVFVQERSGD